MGERTGEASETARVVAKKGKHADSRCRGEPRDDGVERSEASERDDDDDDDGRRRQKELYGFLEIAGENAQRDAATGAAEDRSGNGAVTEREKGG